LALSTLIQARDCKLDAIEDHDNTFIVGFYLFYTFYILTTSQVEEDFAMIAAASLDWVRIPVPF
jgi:hypothetical protein